MAFGCALVGVVGAVLTCPGVCVGNDRESTVFTAEGKVWECETENFVNLIFYLELHYSARLLLEGAVSGLG